MDLLDPKLDVVFKHQFARNTDLLIDLINAIRSTHPPLVDLHVINGEITPEEVKSKLVRLDIVAQDATGQVFDVEMQTHHHAGWNARSVYYLARLLSGQLREGQGYEHIQPVIGIHLLDFELFAEPEQAVWDFELRDRQRPEVVLDRCLQLNVLELPKADRLRSHLNPVLAQWVAYFEHFREESVMQEIQHPPIQKAYQGLHAISAEKKAWYQALALEMARHDEATIKAEAEARRAEAEARGEARGEAKGRLDVLRQLLQTKFGDLPSSVEERLHIAEPTQLAHWTRQVLTAETLEQVFDGH